MTEHALYSRFLRGLAKSPDRAAIEVGDQAISYAQAHERALRWAGALARARAGAVGVLAAKSVTAYVGVLAALYAGAAVVPMRTDFPVGRTRQMLDASGATALIVDARGRALLAELDRPEVLVLSAESDPGRALDEPLPVAADDPAYILFTSGSTGRPKGVVITHANAHHYFGLLDQRYDFTPDDVFSQTFDLNFDCGVFDLFCAWGAGATAVALPAHAYRSLPDFVTARGLTVWFSTPGVIDLARRLGGLGARTMPSLRWSFFAGEALKCRDAADWQRAAPESIVENLYGPTELTITVAAHRWSDTSSRLAVNGVVPIGSVHGGHDYLLLDGDDPGERGTDGDTDGDTGELCIAGPQLTPGYLDPRDGDGRFFDRDGRRWYRTGDRVRRVAPGELAYLGRRDAQVQVQGWRVELAEVEQALRSAGVHDAVVVGVPRDGGTELFAFYTGEPVALIDLARRLRTLLPDGVLPKHYRNVDAFPLNSNGKIDRAALTSRAAALLGGG